VPLAEQPRRRERRRRVARRKVAFPAVPADAAWPVPTSGHPKVADEVGRSLAVLSRVHWALDDGERGPEER